MFIRYLYLTARPTAAWRTSTYFKTYIISSDLLTHDLYIFSESTTPPHEQLPVVFESTDDPSLNLTRTDLNCDKTGTCYDG